MALPTAAARSLACHSCRQWMLRSFIASIGGSSIQPANRRAFSTPSIRLNKARERIQKEEKEEHDAGGERAAFAKENETTSSSSGENAHVPWYLQVESPIPEQENVVSARQKIPDLPEHSPPILEPLLERISVELGMDDLSLLDLRGLDPPAALGANLLMIIGTARSEKHLHFSADKLCRWLRSEHHLSPYADGLLGRQELKLKMRRRAKRSRLLSAVGAKSTADTELDEGIRTGWICVNLGRVEGGDLPKSEEEIEREANVVGFGTQTSGARIVVQLMTEEKRGEIDLEKLWTAVLKKSTKEKEALLEKEAEQEGEAAESNIQQPGLQAGHECSLNTSLGQQQVRAYHTSARRVQVTAMDQPTENHVEPPLVSSDEREVEVQFLPGITPMLETLTKMPQDTALTTLGDDFMSSEESADSPVGSEMKGLSEFVKSFYSQMPPFPTASHWHAHVQLIAFAYRIEHPNATEELVMSAMENMAISGFMPLERTYMTILGTLLRKIDRKSPTFEDQLKLVFDVLEEMEHYGYSALRPEILEALHRTMVGPPSSPQPMTLQSLLPALGIARLKRHLASEDMKKFWQSWNSFPRRFVPRSQEMYVVLYDALAMEETALDFHDTREILSYWINEMGHEDPPVRIEDGGVELAMSLFKVMKHVDPLAEIKEWNGVRGKCEEVLRAALKQ